MLTTTNMTIRYGNDMVQPTNILEICINIQIMEEFIHYSLPYTGFIHDCIYLVLYIFISYFV